MPVASVLVLAQRPRLAIQGSPVYRPRYFASPEWLFQALALALALGPLEYQIFALQIGQHYLIQYSLALFAEYF